VSTPTTALMPDMTLTEVESRSQARELVPMDEDTFRAFYERMAKSVWAYIARITGDRQLADDLLQETFYRFYRAAETFESESHQRNFLFRIATNVAVDARRRGKRAQLMPLPEDDESGAIPMDAALAERAAGRTDLERAMRELRPEQREMLWLAYGQGSSHAEIAQVLGLKTASIKLLLFRARKQLARILRNDR
jgi:RNA polymerase sigma-70 factor, ECF subfamily